MKTKTFDIKLWIKDKESQEIIELKKREDIEIRWQGKGGKAEKEVIFNKGGKEYRILVSIFIEKYLLGMRRTVSESKFHSPLHANYEVYKGYKGEPNNSPEKDRERQDEGSILVDQWNWGSICFFSLLMIFVIIVVFWLLFRSLKRSEYD